MKRFSFKYSFLAGMAVLLCLGGALPPGADPVFPVRGERVTDGGVFLVFKTDVGFAGLLALHKWLNAAPATGRDGKDVSRIALNAEGQSFFTAVAERNSERQAALFKDEVLFVSVTGATVTEGKSSLQVRKSHTESYTLPLLPKSCGPPAIALL